MKDTPTMFAPLDGAAARAATTTRTPHYRALWAESPGQLRAAQALRFMVFNLELREGLARSFESGLDADRFDDCCDHLLVEETGSGTIVGTYRLQTGARAAQCHGYYCEREFEFTPFEPVRGELVELGRACIHAEHRNFSVLNLLWKGIADYARERRARYLIGCSSLSSQDPRVGAAAYRRLRPHLVPAAQRTVPRAGYACALHEAAAEPVKIPKLLCAYLALGAGICAPPALDREFKTIDFLTLVDLDASGLQRRARFAAGRR